MGDQLPTGQLSVVPWRRTGVKYTNNEAYFVHTWVGKIPWRKDRLPTPVFLGFLVIQRIKNLPTMQEMQQEPQVPGLGRCPEKEMTTHSSILDWEIPRTEELVGVVHGSQKSQT